MTINKIMNLQTYQNLTSRTGAELGHPTINAAHYTLGIVGEFKELNDAFLPQVMFESSYNPDEIIKEAGDVLWYCSELANIFNIKLEVEKYDLISAFDSVGIIAENIKKYLAYGKKIDVNILEVHLNNILYTVRYYCERTNTTLEQCMELNIDKLRKRYPEKFTAVDALNKLDENG